MLCKDDGREEVEVYWATKFLETYVDYCKAIEAAPDKKVDHGHHDGIEKDPLFVSILSGLACWDSSCQECHTPESRCSSMATTLQLNPDWDFALLCCFMCLLVVLA